jgi:HlyD family secretion protein
LENELLSKQQTMKVEMKESGIAAQIQDNDLRDLQRKLDLANIVANRAGVVTWVNKNIGAAVREGESLARIADLASFKITGNISDNYMDQLHAGMDVIVRINDNQLRGRIVTIYPAVQNGIISFDVQLDPGNNAKLRPDLKVDVYPVTAKRDNVLRIANGAAFKGSATQDVFVVKDGKAVRRRVHVGMSNFDYVEILDNVQAGEVIITSDMSEFANTREIKIQP